MVRRWIIRSVALMLLTLCVVVWVGSYWIGVGVTYRGADVYDMGILHGKICSGNLNVISMRAPQGVHFFLLHHYPGLLLGGEDREYYFLGFWCLKNPRGAELEIPIYFPTLLSVFLLWFVWRKTRAKAAGKAFPVEMAAKAGGSAP